MGLPAHWTIPVAFQAGKGLGPIGPDPCAKRSIPHPYFTMMPQVNAVRSPSLTPQARTVISLPAPAG